MLDNGVRDGREQVDRAAERCGEAAADELQGRRAIAGDELSVRVRLEFLSMSFRHLRPSLISRSLDDKGSPPGDDDQGVGQKISRRIVANHHLSLASQNVVKAELVRLIECQFVTRTDQALGQPDGMYLQSLHQAVEMSAGDPCNRTTEPP